MFFQIHIRSLPDQLPVADLEAFGELISMGVWNLMQIDPKGTAGTVAEVSALLQEDQILTSVISVKVCRPELSWMVLMATGIFTVSPPGVQNPFNTNKMCSCNHIDYHESLKLV